MLKTAKKVIEAYGGIELWEKSIGIEAIVSVDGLLFKLKGIEAFNNVKVEIDLNRFYSSITPINDDPDLSGIFDKERVYIQNSSGRIIKERKNPRKYFPYGRRLFYWDDLDKTYFANYALWNYFAFPKLLMDNRIKWVEKENLLLAEFPDDFPTHSQKQSFYFDKDTCLLKQHNYTAEVVSGLATAANVVKSHISENRIVYASHRVVTPQSKKYGYLNKPIIVEEVVHSCHLI